MNKLEEVKKRLYETKASLVVCYENGEYKEYYQNRIKDIKEILQANELALKGAVIADKVIGKVAASVLIIAGVKQIYADVISQYAVSILDEHEVKYEYKILTDYIINNDQTGMCPMEKKYKEEKDINKIYQEMIEQKEHD